MESFIKSEKHDACREIAVSLIKRGKMSLEEIAECIPSLSLDELSMISETEKAKRNAEYLAMIDESVAQFKRGETISFTLEELREMEDESWKPTEKILEFEKKYGIQRKS